MVCPIGAIPNFATEKEQKRNFLDFNDVTLVVVDIKSERFVKSTCLQQDLFDMTMVTIMFDTKYSESESFKCVGVECPSYSILCIIICMIHICPLNFWDSDLKTPLFWHHKIEIVMMSM